MSESASTPINDQPPSETAFWSVLFSGEPATFTRLKLLMPEVGQIADGNAVGLRDRSFPVELVGADLDAAIQRFTDLANSLLVIGAPTDPPIVPAGGRFRVDAQGGHDRHMTPGTGQLEFIGYAPVIVSGAGFAGTPRPAPRPVHVRQRELMIRDSFFADACKFLAQSHSDWSKLRFAMEAIERGHQWPSVNDRNDPATKAQKKAKQESICASLGMPRTQWEAFRRTMRPEFHPYPEGMEGPIFRRTAARVGIQNALMWWLKREVPI